MSPTLIGPDGNASEVMVALDVERRRRGWSMADTEEWIGVSTSAWFQWKLGRPPRLLCLLDLLDGLGFRLGLADGLESLPVSGSTAAIFSQIDQRRRALGLEVPDLEAKAGISQSTYFACLAGTRNPSIRTLTKLANALGWQVVVAEV